MTRLRMIRVHQPVEVGPVDGVDRFVGQAQPLQHDDRLGRRIVDGQLDVGEHVDRIALAHQQRATLARCVEGEPMAIEDAGAHRQRVDAEAAPRQVRERQRGVDLDLDVVGRDVNGSQQLDGPLGDRRRAGHGVEDRAQLVR